MGVSSAEDGHDPGQGGVSAGTHVQGSNGQPGRVNADHEAIAASRAARRRTMPRLRAASSR